ncbi:hypothetical protein Goshw_021516 [Gossypium schwendimanii]|uniref:NAB domain-containing protein n=1 Tax=Gossypium schwendimanii TaxID=34291 RepID=A0A7J9M6B3_GOSSC|nr:hypothetical protein [Gossypium schwendimanii]
MMLQKVASNAYSWWWASHIRTKQSKWLEQNLHGNNAFYANHLIFISSMYADMYTDLDLTRVRRSTRLISHPLPANTQEHANLACDSYP